MCRRVWQKRKAAILIQLYIRKWKSKAYLTNVCKTFQNVDNDPLWGKTTRWPAAPRTLADGERLVKNLWRTWRSRNIITKLSPDEQGEMRQKVLTRDLFSGKKQWDVPRRYEADYLEKPSNPHQKTYCEVSKELFAKFNDTNILFADYVDKINPNGKSQRRGLVVTEKNIYKHNPVNYKVKKIAIPISTVTGISLSPYSDNFVIIGVLYPARDIVISIEKYAEFVTVLYQAYENLMSAKTPLVFVDRIPYNNSREGKDPGQDNTLTFQRVGPKDKPNTFAKGKNNIMIVNYP